MCKTLQTQKFRAPRLSWYPFGGVWRPIQLSHLKNHEFQFFTKLPTKPSSYAVVHRPSWPCAKHTELKTFVHQDFHCIHLGAFGGLSNPHISKITNFIFSQNSPPSHLAMLWCTANLYNTLSLITKCWIHTNSSFLNSEYIFVFHISTMSPWYQPSHLNHMPSSYQTHHPQSMNHSTHA